MYVTRPLSLYLNYPNAVNDAPPEGPNSGILVIEDVEAEEQARCCWGLCKSTRIMNLPFPQNRKIRIEYSTGVGKNQSTSVDNVYCIPVMSQPLSSNRYYVIRANGKYGGKTSTCSKEEDATTCCLCTFAKELKPIPSDHRDIYQQVEIIGGKGQFHAKSVALDGIPPHFLKRKHWDAYTSKPSHYSLEEAQGLNKALRSQLPNLNFPIPTKRSAPITVGKWYCPFIFVKEGNSLKDQMKLSTFYEMTLQQFWEEIYTCENVYDEVSKVVEVGVNVTREMALMNGGEVVKEKPEIVDGVVWFKPKNSVVSGLGLSSPIWERMRWEEARGGWVGGEEEERVERVEMYEGQGGWKKFGCCVLVERFVMKRMDGSLALTYDFKHTNKIRVKWE